MLSDVYGINTEYDLSMPALFEGDDACLLWVVLLCADKEFVILLVIIYDNFP